MDIDSPLDQQERYIAYGSGAFFIIVVGLIILAADLQLAIQEWFIRFTSADIYKEYLAIASVSAISFAVGYFIKYLGIHKYTDKIFFGFERQVNNYIIRSLRRYLATHCGLCLHRQPTNRELMDIFFEFINKQSDSAVVQRALYFSYFTKYGISMNIFILSIFGIALIFGVDLYKNSYSPISVLAYSFFIALGTLAFLISQLKIRREIIDDITRRQIYRIVYDECDLKKTFTNRFANAEDYSPRDYKQDVELEVPEAKKEENNAERKETRNKIIRFENLKILAAVLIISGIIFAIGGISTGLLAPIFSDFKRQNQNGSSLQTLPSIESDANSRPVQILTEFVMVGTILLVIGIFLMKLKTDTRLYGAAGVTGIAGILYLVLALNEISFNIIIAMILTIIGIVQLFWILPVMNLWGGKWYYAGIIGTGIGTAILVASWALIGLASKPIAVIISIIISQVLFVIINVIIVSKLPRTSKSA